MTAAPSAILLFTAAPSAAGEPAFDPRAIDAFSLQDILPREPVDEAIAQAFALRENGESEAAAALLEPQAAAGKLSAQMALAFMYARGEGIARDPARAARWWRAAADQGQGYAQFAFAEAALNGGGTVRDPVLAHAYLTIAAERTQRGGPFLELVRETLAQATAALDADGRAASAAFVAAWYEARPALAPPERLLPAPASPPTPEER